MSKRPVIKKKLLLIEQHLLDRITKMAKKEHRTVNAEIIDILENALPSKEMFVQKITTRRNALYERVKKGSKEPVIESVDIEEEMTAEEMEEFLKSIDIK